MNSNQNAHNIDVACEWPPGQFNCVPAASPPAGDNDDALLPPADDDAAQEEPLLAARQGQVRANLTLYDDSKKNPESVEASILCTEIGKSRCYKFSELYFCCCLPFLPHLACSIHATWSFDF